MYEIVNHTGRLIEIRIWSPVTIDEAVAWRRDHDATVARVGGPYVCMTDVVDATVFPQGVADAYGATMRYEPDLVRTGVLINESPTLGWQVDRLVREAHSAVRRVFRDPDELEAWLGEVLDENERARLRNVLGRRR